MERQVQHLGYTFDWKEDGMVLVHQRNYCLKVLEDLSMSTAYPIKGTATDNLVKQASKPANPIDVNVMEKSIVMLNHLALHTRPDILHIVNVLSHYTTKPTAQHWSLIKQLL